MRRLKPSPDPAIWKALGHQFWRTIDDVTTATGLDKGTVGARVLRMHKDGRLHRQPSPQGFQYRKIKDESL